MSSSTYRLFRWQSACLAAALTVFSLGGVAIAQDQDPAAQNVAPDNGGQNTQPQQDTRPAKRSNAMPDAQIEANVLGALAGEPSLADQPISTTTTYGVVTLSGTVKDEASKKLAARLASTAPGVKKVVDSLEVGDISNAQVQAGEGAAPLPNAAPAPDAQGSAENGAPTQQPPANEQGGGQPYPDQQNYPNQQQGSGYGPQGYPGGYPPPPPGYGPQGQPRRSYASSYPNQQAGRQVTVAPGAHLQVRISQGLDGKHTPVGTTFNGILMNDVMANGFVALPRGAEVVGTVVDAKAAGGLTGSGAIALQLTGVSIDGQQYPLESNVWGVNGPSKTGQTVGNTVGLGLLGAVIGGVAGGGPGAAIGAVAGGTAGLATSAATSGPQAGLHPESIVNFALAKPATVTTVSPQVLARLAQGSGAPSPRGYPAPPPRGYYYYGPAGYYYRPYGYYGRRYYYYPY